ncbi:MAG: hypothetical protein IK064_05940 [Clostridia bacterium]|nr:hypothetical protein [Clostridia bacterium]
MRRSVFILIAFAVCLFAAAGALSCAKNAGPAGQTGDPVVLPISASPADEPTKAPNGPVTDSEAAVAFRNGLVSCAAEIYLSPKSEGEWGAPVLLSVESGTVRELPFAAFGTPGRVYDIGTLDEDGINYDAFGVLLRGGDSIELTGDCESGMYTVVHRDGSRDHYTAKVYWNDPQPVEQIAITAETRTETVTDKQTGKSGTVCRVVLTVSDEAAQRWPELASAVEALNKRRYDELIDIAAEIIGGEEDAGAAPLAEDIVRIMRTDSGIVSFLFERRSGSGSVFSGVNLDPATGALLTPADVVTEVRRLPSLINKQLRAAGSLLELNVYRDHAADFSAEKADYAFALSAEGAVFVFNVNAFRSGITEPAEVLIRYSDDPFLIRPGFRIAGNE